MKFMLLALCILTSSFAFGAEGNITVLAAKNKANTLNLTIKGDAATTISGQLETNGVSFQRDSFTGALIQIGEGVRCIDQHDDKPLYCYIAITGSAVN